MAYKFQLGAAKLAGSLTTEDITTDADGVISGSIGRFTHISCSANSMVLGSTTISEAEIQLLDAFEDAATAPANDKFVFLDANAAGGAKFRSVAMANAIVADMIATDSVDGSKIADDSINSEHYAAGSIDTAHIANDQITNALMADDAIDSAQLADGSIDLIHMSANSVDSDQYVDGSIDLIHMSANSIDSDQYVDGSIDRAHLAADIVDGTKIADDAVANEHIAANAVDTAQLAADSVETAKIADSNVTNAKLANSALTIGSTSVALGASSTVFAGITQLTASAIRVTDLDVVNINSISQTEQTLEITDKLVVSALSASSANADGGGLQIGGGASTTGQAAVKWSHGGSALKFSIGANDEFMVKANAFLPEGSNAKALGSDGNRFSEVHTRNIFFAGTQISATAAELNYLDNDDLTAADITKLAALTATAAEINYLDNDDLTAADITKLAALTATAAELNKLDGASADVTAAKLSTLAALTNTEIAYVDGATAGTALASKALVLDASKDIAGINAVDAAELSGSLEYKISAGNGIAPFDWRNGANASVQIQLNAGAGAGSSFDVTSNGLELKSTVAGDGLALASGILAVRVDDSSIETDSDIMRVKALGVATDMIADDAVTAAKLASNAVVNASVAANAAIAHTKLAGITAASILMGNASGVATATAVSGELTLANNGALSINANAVTNAKMADDSVGAAELIDNSVGAAAMADDAIETAFIADDQVTYAKVQNVSATARILGRNTSGPGVIEEVTPAQLMGMFNSDLGGNFTIGNQSSDSATFAGAVVVGGDLTVNGTTTTVNSTTVQIDDLNLQLADGTAAASAVNGGGITLATSGDDFTFAYNHTTTAWKSSIDMDLASNKLLKINGAEVLSAAGAVKVQDGVAGAGLAASSGVLSVGVDGTGIEINSDALRLKDAGVTAAKMANLAATNLYVGNGSARPTAVALSGDVTMDNAGAVTIAAAAVEAGMLNANVISAQTELASGGVVDADELMISDGGVLKKVGVDSLKGYMYHEEVALKDDGETLAVGVNYFGDHGGAESCPLPASAGMVVGQSVLIKSGGDCSATNKLTITTATAQKIDGVDSIVMESPYAAVRLVYVAADQFRVF